MAPPIVETTDATVFVTSLISASNLFSATDSDDAIVSYTFQDFRSGPSSGFFVNNGVPQENGGTFTIPASELPNVSYRGGTEIFFEGFRVFARDEAGNTSSPFAISKIYTVRSNTTAPHVKAPFFSALANEYVAGSEFIGGFDPDGYPLTHFRISEANTVLELAASSDVLTVTIFDHRFETGDTVTIKGQDQAAYNVTGQITVLDQHTFRIAATGAPDGSGSGAIEAFTKDGGYFEVDGVAQPQGETFTITPDQVETLKYFAFGGPSQENIFVEGFDGVDWSYKKRGIATIINNANRPVVQFGNTSTPAGELLPIAGKFNVTDADQNSIKYYWFYNTSPHAQKGDLIFKGAIMPRTQWFLVRQEDLGQLYYKTTLIDDEQQIRIRAFDGKHLSTPGTLVIKSTPPLVPPEISFDPMEEMPVIAEDRRRVPFPEIIQTGPGVPFTHRQVYDPSTDGDSGYLRDQRIELAGGEFHEFPAIEIDENGNEIKVEDRLDIITGAFSDRRIDTMYVRDRNEVGWSSWEKFDVHTEPDYDRALRSGVTWSWYMPFNTVTEKLEITYSFMQEFPAYDSSGEAADGDPAENKQFEVLTATQQDNVRRAFEGLEELVNVEFFEISDFDTNVFGGQGGIIRLGEYGEDGDNSVPSYSDGPGFGDVPGDMWFNRLLFPGGPDGPEMDFTPGTTGYTAFLREFGNVMGLKRPDTGSPRLPASTNSNDFSVMSETPATGGGEPTTFQLYDISELQDLYGANMSTKTGNTVYSLYRTWGGNMNVTESIWDADGFDTLSAVGSPGSSIIDLRQGQLSSIGAVTNNIAIAHGVEIEYALGSGFDDMVYGNELDNMLQGRVGNDYLKGFAGNDYLVGGEDNDIFEWGVGDDNDIINEWDGGGTDRIRIADFPTVDDLTEDFRFRLQGNDLYVDLHIDGGSLENSIRVIDQLSEGNRIETLELGGVDIDLDNLASQITATTDTFALTTDSTSYGFIVTPA